MKRVKVVHAHASFENNLDGIIQDGRLVTGMYRRDLTKPRVCRHTCYITSNCHLAE